MPTEREMETDMQDLYSPIVAVKRHSPVDDRPIPKATKNFSFTKMPWLKVIYEKGQAFK